MSEESQDPEFELPPGLSEVDVIQAARARGLLTEEEIQVARGARVREARREIYRSVFVYLIETGAATERQITRLIDELSELDRPDEPLGYRFLQKLGSGSMGTVYLAVQQCLDRVVAVKMLARQYSRNKHYVERFERESMLGAETASPYFPAVYEAGRWRGQQYISMEYVRGDSVEGQLEAGKLYSPEEVIDLAIEVTFALEYLHSLSIVHRDVKPQNIVIGHDGQLKLMDLGLARKLNDTVQIDAERGNAIGTPFYISPEQIRGLDVDERSDLYSLGCTMYHLLVGKPPFQAPQTSQILDQHLHSEAEPPSARVTGVPRNLERMVLWLMEKDPNRRKAAARKVRHELLTIEAQLNPAAFRLKRGVAKINEEQDDEPRGLGAEQYASHRVPLPQMDLDDDPELGDDLIDAEAVAREVFGEELDDLIDSDPAEDNGSTESSSPRKAAES